MLSDRNIRSINYQITDELRKVNSICSSHEEKLEAMERIVKLKELLMQPSREDILTELAAALEKEQRKPNKDITLGDIFDAFRRR